jgi:putative transposase
MDEEHLAAALRYVSLNPVRGRRVARAQDWRWSSTRAHLTGKDDGITARAPIRERVPRFADLLATEPGDEASGSFARLRAAESIGRPLGDDRFLARIERVTKRILKPQRRGPKPRANGKAKIARNQVRCHRNCPENLRTKDVTGYEKK